MPDKAKKHVISTKEFIGSPPQYITVKGLAGVLGVSESTVRRWIKSGKIKSTSVTCISWKVFSSLDLKYMKNNEGLEVKDQ